MVPVFSARALELCQHTFSMSESGWGLDTLWPRFVDTLGVFDSCVVEHVRPQQSKQWILSDGLTPTEELARITKLYAAR